MRNIFLFLKFSAFGQQDQDIIAQLILKDKSIVTSQRLNLV